MHAAINNQARYLGVQYVNEDARLILVVVKKKRTWSTAAGISCASRGRAPEDWARPVSLATRACSSSICTGLCAPAAPRPESSFRDRIITIRLLSPGDRSMDGPNPTGFGRQKG